MLEIQDILRAQEVHRWNIVATIRNQSLAEHTFNVVFIARAICKEMNHPDDAVIKLALEHDLDEIVTGDIPTPTKDRMRQLGFNPDDVHGGEVKSRGGIAKAIVKAADMIEASWFIEQNAITRHAQEVKQYMMARTRDHLDIMCDDDREEMGWRKAAGFSAKKVWRQIREGKITI